MVMEAVLAGDSLSEVFAVVMVDLAWGVAAGAMVVAALSAALGVGVGLTVTGTELATVLESALASLSWLAAAGVVEVATALVSRWEDLAGVGSSEAGLVPLAWRGKPTQPNAKPILYK